MLAPQASSYIKHWFYCGCCVRLMMIGLFFPRFTGCWCLIRRKNDGFQGVGAKIDEKIRLPQGVKALFDEKIPFHRVWKPDSTKKFHFHRVRSSNSTKKQGIHRVLGSDSTAKFCPYRVFRHPPTLFWGLFNILQAHTCFETVSS